MFILKVFTIWFDGEFLFSHCEKFNVKICVYIGEILMSITVRILRLKQIIFTV